MTVIKPFFASNPSPSPHQSPQCTSLLRGHPPLLFVFVVSFRLQYLLAQECRLPRTKGQSKCMGWTMLFGGYVGKKKAQGPTGHSRMRLDQVRQECSGQQADWACWLSFKLDSTGEGDVLLSDREQPGDTKNVGSNRKIPVNYPKGIREGISKKVTQLTAQLKCLHTNAYSMGNKREELETTVQLGNYGLIAITETLQDESHCNWWQQAFQNR